MDPDSPSSSVKAAIWPQVLVTITASLSATSQGVSAAFPSRAIPSLLVEDDENLRMPMEILSFYAGMHLLAFMVWCIIGGLISTKFGRRNCFLLFSIPSITGWILTWWAWDKTTLFLGRALASTGSGGSLATIGVYISEMVEPKLRGSLAVFQSLFMAIGILLIYGIGYFLTWRQMALMSIIPPTLQLLLLLILPETPYWLVDNHRYDEAKKSLYFVRRNEEIATRELEEIINCHEEKLKTQTQRHSWTWLRKRLTSSSFIRPYISMTFLCITIEWSGMMILIMYMVTIFTEVKSSVDPHLAPVIVGGIRVVSACFSSLIMRYANRKYLFIVCMSFLAMGNCAIATFSYLKTLYPDHPILEQVGWIPVVAVTGIFVSNAIGIIPVLHLLLGEVFPTEIRSIGIGITQTTFITLGFIHVTVFPQLVKLMSFHALFYTYMVITTIGACWGAFTIPDYRGLSLVHIENKQTRSIESKPKTEKT